MRRAAAAFGILAVLVVPAAVSHQAEGTTTPVVLAFVDSGVNPYLPIFHVENDAPFRASVTAPFTTVTLSQGEDIPELIIRDAHIWNNMEPGVLYHFAGTRVFSVSVMPPTIYRYNLDYAGHGAPVTYIGAREAPDATIVMVQVDLDICLEIVGPDCPYPIGNIADALTWASDQDWIDVISVSLGLTGNPFIPPAADERVKRHLDATESAARSGKLVLAGAGNTIAPPVTSHIAGPPWVIAVGGVESETRGEHVLPGRTVDVVANYSDFLPRWRDGKPQWLSGTSYASPNVAGTLARAIDIIHRTDPSRAISSQEIRDALNATAIQYGPLEWDPQPLDERHEFPWWLGYTNVPVVSPTQMGWGYVDGGYAPEIARRVLENDYSIPIDKLPAAAFQTGWQLSREAFWTPHR